MTDQTFSDLLAAAERAATDLCDLRVNGKEAWGSLDDFNKIASPMRIAALCKRLAAAEALHLALEMYIAAQVALELKLTTRADSQIAWFKVCNAMKEFKPIIQVKEAPPVAPKGPANAP